MAASATTLSATAGLQSFEPGSEVSVRFRNGDQSLSGVDEILLAPDGTPGSGADRVRGDYAWQLNSPVNFSFSYDADGGAGGQGLLTAMLGGSTVILGDDVSESLSSDLQFDALNIRINARGGGAQTFSVTQLAINGMNVQNLPLNVQQAKRRYSVTGFSLTADFTITGTLLRAGNSLGLLRQRPRIDFNMGKTEAVPLPAAAWLMLAGLGGLGLAKRLRRTA